MTTDDKDTKITNEKPNTEAPKTDIPEPKSEETKETEMSDSEKAFLDRMTKVFETKLTETVDKYQKEIDDLKKSVAEKDNDIAKLRKVNSEILMSTDLSGKNNGNIDFNTAEFSEVDWDAQVKTTLEAIDKKIC